MDKYTREALKETTLAALMFLALIVGLPVAVYVVALVLLAAGLEPEIVKALIWPLLGVIAGAFFFIDIVKMSAQFKRDRAEREAERAKRDEDLRRLTGR